MKRGYILILSLAFIIVSAFLLAPYGVSLMPIVPSIPSSMVFPPLPCPSLNQAEASQEGKDKFHDQSTTPPSTRFTWKSSSSVYSIPKQIRYTFSVQNLENRPARNLKLWVYAPCLKTNSQALKSLKTSYPARTLQDQQGNIICEFSIPEMAPYETKIFRLRADLGMSEKSQILALPDASAYLQPQRLIESDHTLIKEKALKLQKEDSYQTAKALYQWVADNVKSSGLLEEDKGALYAIRNLSGDCTEYAALFVALCRAAGIPARLLGGYVCQRNCIVTTVDFHNWAEFYYETAPHEGAHEGAWHLVDPQNKIFDQHSEDHIATEAYNGEAHNGEVYTGDNQNPIGEYHRYRFQGVEGGRFKVKMTD